MHEMPPAPNLTTLPERENDLEAIVREFQLEQVVEALGLESEDSSSLFEIGKALMGESSELGPKTLKVIEKLSPERRRALHQVLQLIVRGRLRSKRSIGGTQIDPGMNYRFDTGSRRIDSSGTKGGRKAA